jgi:DNA repair exonuclease SbcCD nuclease subunit
MKKYKSTKTKKEDVKDTKKNDIKDVKKNDNTDVNEEEVSFIDLEFPEKIERLYHISDIHIRLQKRHDEYRKVFTNLYTSLKEDVEISLGGNKNKGLIVLTGDILHSKTELSPECVSLTADFFQSLAQIMPLIIIAGNHDANLNNNNRLDSLTPIVEKVIKKSQCYYLRQSGFYRFSNIVFGLTSVFDYRFMKSNMLDILGLEGIEHKIALFHGRINGAITDTGSILEGEKGINVKSFSGYDYALLGDIHKHQFMIPNKIAYAGSLIQQNHGETQNNHGFLIWDLKNNKSFLKEIKNDTGFITLKIKNGKLIKNKDTYIPSKCYLRLEIDYLTKK